MAISWWGKGLWHICMHHRQIICKSRISKISTRFHNQGGVDHLSTFDPELRNVSSALISFMGFPAILSALQPFQICIQKRKYSKLTFSNGSQLMGKGLWHICMHHWRVHAKRNFQDFHQMSQPGREGSWTQKCKFCIDIFYGVSCNIKCITAISNLHLQEKI